MSLGFDDEGVICGALNVSSPLFLKKVEVLAVE